MRQTFYRDDFKTLSDGSSFFDSILGNARIPEELHAKIYCIEVAISDPTDALDEDNNPINLPG